MPFKPQMQMRMKNMKPAMKTPSILREALGVASMALVAALMSACSSVYPPQQAATPPQETSAAAKAAPPVVPAPAPSKPAPRAPSAGEVALAEGLKAYKAGQYKQSEAQLKAALKAGLDAPADLANAHKHLAFIYCTSKRTTLCAAAFKNAKAADPSFALSKAEAGHPMWGSTYRKALGR